MRRVSLFFALATTLLSAQGCLYSRYNTNTGRSATEQLLLSDSIRRVVERLDLPDVDGKAVSLEISAIPSSEVAYLKAALEGRLGRAGARLVGSDQAELRVVALVGAVGTVDRNASFGIPSLPIPPVGSTPPIPFVSAKRQRGYTQAQLLTWDATGGLVDTSDPVIEASKFDITSILFLEIRRNDVFPGEGSYSIAID